MIDELDLARDDVAEAVHRIANRAYAVEAELIGSTAIPALHEAVDRMRARPLRWFGAHVDGALAGFVGWSRIDGVLDIDRLCVDPAHFRRGLATRLVARVLAEGGPAEVSTGAANAPAIALYRRLGFARTGTVEPEPGLLVATFRRPSPARAP